MNFFNIIFKRVATFSIQSYDYNKTDILSFFNSNELFQLSVLISSRSLYEDAKKNKSEKTKKALEKYFSRAHFKPVPFGSFASIGTSKWNNHTLVKKSHNIKLKAGFDNLFLSKKINNSVAERWATSTYCTNPTIHFLNEKKVSFYRSKIVSNSGNEAFEISFIEIDHDENTSWIIERFSSGSKMAEVIDELILEGFDKEEIDLFLGEVVETGLIVNDFLFNPYNSKLNKSNEFYTSTLIDALSHNLKNTEDVLEFSKKYINEQDSILKEIDSKNSHAIYSIDDNEGFLNLNIQDKIRKYIDFTIYYNKHNIPFNKKLEKFRIELSHRFNDGFIPITKVFNPNSGLDFASITTDYKAELHKDILNTILASDGNDIFFKMPAKGEKEKKPEKLPATFSVVFEILKCKNTGKEITYFKGLGGASALNLISRFGETASDLCKEIAEYEKSIHENKIVAEINMISNLRSVNLLSNQQYYDYNIPVNTSYSNSINPILLTDIYIHLEGQNFSLMSKEHSKQILPKTISAINFKISDFQFYRFLSEMEFQNEEIYATNFNLTTYKNLYLPYVSRIYLEDDILLYGAQMLLIFNNQTYNEFKIYLQEKIKKYSFSKKIVIADIKGELILDTENENHIYLIFEKMKSASHLYISECLYESFDPQIVNDTENFSHEFVVGVKNTDYITSSKVYEFSDIDKNNSDQIPLLNDWLYLELYCNSYAENDILRYIYEEIILEVEIDLFFFVRYNYPKNHLRVRFKSNNLKTNEYIIDKIQKLKVASLIYQYQILPYQQEIHRYGGVDLMKISETVFSLDTADTLKNAVYNKTQYQNNEINAILKINTYLNLLKLTLEDKIIFCERFIALFTNEFKLDAELRKTFNKCYSEIKSDLVRADYDNFLMDGELQENINSTLDKSPLKKHNYLGSLIHMSMNRLFNENQRFNEFKAYYLTKSYLNQIKFTEKQELIN